MWPYSQVNLDRMALQLALTKANPRRLYIVRKWSWTWVRLAWWKGDLQA